MFAYYDADFAGSLIDRKGNTGTCHFVRIELHLGSFAFDCLIMVDTGSIFFIKKKKGNCLIKWEPTLNLYFCDMHEFRD